METEAGKSPTKKESKMIAVKDMVKDGKRVRFTRYSKRELWYATEDGFEFPVPISDTGDASFMAEDKAMLFMRWIRKQHDLLKAEIDRIQDLKDALQVQER